MQLITMAMSEGDQGKSDNSKNNRQSSSSAGTANTQSRMVHQSQVDNFQHDNENHLQTADPELHRYSDTLGFSIPTVITHDAVDRGRSSSTHHTPVNTSPPSQNTPYASASPADFLQDSVVRSGHSLFPALQMQEVVCDYRCSDTEDNSERALSEEPEEYSDQCQSKSEEDITSEVSVALGATYDPSCERDGHNKGHSEKDTGSGLKLTCEGMDENMNITGTQNNNLIHLPKLPVEDLSQPPSDIESTSAASPEMCSEEFEQDSALDSVPPTLVENSSAVEHLDTEYDEGSTSSLNHRGISEKNSLKLILSSYSSAFARLSEHTNSVQASPLQLNCFQHDRFVGPPIWTSLALREFVGIYPDIVHPLPQLASPQAAMVTSGHHPSTFLPIPDMERLTPTFEVDSHQSYRSLTRPEGMNDNDIPEHYVFQSCCRENVETDSSACMDESVNGDVTRHEADNCEDITEDLDVECNITNSHSLALQDLDCFLRMLPTICDDGDLASSQLCDDEVATMTYRNSDDVEEDELVAIDFTNEVSNVARSSNPMAHLLEHGGHEHFLPVIPDAFQDPVLHD